MVLCYRAGPNYYKIDEYISSHLCLIFSVVFFVRKDVEVIILD